MYTIPKQFKTQYSRRNYVEILGLPDIFTGDQLTKKVIELCNDVGVMVETRDMASCHRLFQKESSNQLSKRTFVRFVRRRFAEDLLSNWNINLTLDFNKLRYLRAGVQRDPFKPSIWRGQLYYNSKFFWYFRYKFFDVKLLILENVLPQMLLSVIYHTRASFFWSKRYTQQNINTC